MNSLACWRFVQEPSYGVCIAIIDEVGRKSMLALNKQSIAGFFTAWSKEYRP